MPSWSARNNPLSNPPNSHHHHFASPPQSHPHPSTPRALPQDVPILPSRPIASNPVLAMASSSSSPRQRRGHTRSISHPFNGVLSGRGVGKKHNRSISKDVLMDSDDDDGDPYEFTFTPMPLASSPKKAMPRPLLVDGTEDFSTGKCLTCSMMMRWPKNLSTFRCTECLMVNDLEVSGDTGKAGGDDGRPAIPRKAIPISFDRTKGIIDNCVASYMRKLLEAPETRPLPIKTPSASRLGQSPNRGNGYLSDCSSGDPQSRTPSGPSSPTKPKTGASSYPTTYQSLFPPSPGPVPRGRSNSDMQDSPKPDRARPFVAEPKDPANQPMLFRPVEDYIISSFKGCDCLNVSFSTSQQPPQSARDASPTKPVPDPPGGAKLRPEGLARSTDLCNGHSREKSSGSTRLVTSRSPRINWAELAQWYHLILTAGTSWVELWSAMQPADVYSEEDALRKKRWDSVDLTVVDREIAEARFHLQRMLLKATENLLKRPRRPLRRPEDTRFLLMLLANPMLYPSSSLPGVQAAAVMPHKDKLEPSNTRDRDRPVPPNGKSPRKEPTKQRSRGPGGHSGIIKRIMGLISSLPNDIHHFLISWFSRFSVGQFERIVDLVGSFFTYRLTRQHGRKHGESFKTDDSLIPSFSSASGNTPAELHAAINGRNQNKSSKNENQPTVYGDDWQILAACRVMSLLFSANNAGGQRKPDEDLEDTARRNQVINRGHLIPISSFYNTLLDYSDLVADFEGWESKTSRFSFCQYPFFLSIWAKIHILEHDARRQMEVRAREAFFSSILSRRAVSQYLVLKVRRDCLVEDSLKRISEVVWNSQQEIKKGLRVEFLGEEGVDAGGLRKEWFLLLVRDVFDPNHGLFIYDEDSQYCYFNPFCFESSEQFFLVGVLLGLAIYNSTILDMALPPFAFRKLLAAAPLQQNGPSSSTTPRAGFKSTLDDLAEYRPALAKGLRGLLEFEGDVAETFCYDFVAQLDRYGERVAVPLCEGGEKRQVTNSNRREFVDLYVQQLLDVSVMRQFQPFKRGFFTVCGGNALSLFRSEEIELLVRGSDEPLDVPSLKAVATYDNWPNPQADGEPVVQWFWDFFQNTQPAAQRKILSFITGSDRIPAMGATSLSIRLTCLGDDASRYPTARTCFNMLGLYRYPTRERLEQVLWEAVVNGEGFGLK